MNLVKQLWIGLCTAFLGLVMLPIAIAIPMPTPAIMIVSSLGGAFITIGIGSASEASKELRKKKRYKHRINTM